MIGPLLALALAAQSAAPADSGVPPVRPRTYLAAYFHDDDCPPEASRNGAQGDVGVRMTVSPDGLVRDCTVISSSGSPSLDAATCRIILERTLFRPAYDVDGRPVADVVASRVHWILPGSDAR